ncbi:MAG: phasin family protein [Micavibrio sp.]
MATKTKSKKPAPQTVKKAAAPLKNKQAAKSAEQFGAFAQNFPQFKPFNMETPMMQGNKQFEKLAQDATALGQEQMDAVMKASSIWAKGVEDFMQTVVEIAAQAGEKSQEATKAIMSCKTLNEFTDAQTKLAQDSFDGFMTNATKLSEKSVKLCTDALEPINDQLGRAIKKASDTMAA